MRQRGMSPFKAGLIAVVVIAVGTYFAFSKEVPFRSHYEVSAVFRSANNVKQRQPVRIAGVDVGQVVGIEHPEPGKSRAVIRMRIKDDGRPVHRDARVKIRPRLFLEGNWLIDLEPGTPDTKEIPDGGTIPIQQTSNPVQLGQVLTALQSDTRKNLQTMFREYSSALEGEGADGFRRSIRHWKGAYRDSALVQEATLGLGEHDLSDYIDGAGRVARGLDRNPAQLKALVTDFDTAAGAFAREAGSLEQAIAELPRTLRTARPALGELNRSLPPLRRFARDLQPSVRESERDDRREPAVPAPGPPPGVARRAARAGARPAPDRAAAGTPDPAHARAVRARPRRRRVRERRDRPVGERPRVRPHLPGHRQGVRGGPQAAAGAGRREPQRRRQRTVGARAHQRRRPHDLARQRHVRAGAVPDPRHQPAQARGVPPLRADVPCETQQPPDLRTKVGPGEREVSRGLPKTAAASKRYERSKRTAMKWVERELKRRGLDRQLKVRP